jgi:hypothetical protein
MVLEARGFLDASGGLRVVAQGCEPGGRDTSGRSSQSFARGALADPLRHLRGLGDTSLARAEEGAWSPRAATTARRIGIAQKPDLRFDLTFWFSKSTMIWRPSSSQR